MLEFDYDAALAQPLTHSLSGRLLYGSDWPDRSTYIYVEVVGGYLFVGKLLGSSSQTPFACQGMRQHHSKEAALDYIIGLASEAYDHGHATSNMRDLLPSDAYVIN